MLAPLEETTLSSTGDGVVNISGRLILSLIVLVSDRICARKGSMVDVTMIEPDAEEEALRAKE